jgi:enoyl-CoA hydratase/carnithine racemase
MYEQIRYEVDDPVAVVTLNRPAQLNAWTPQMDDEVRHAVARAEQDRSVVGIVITGAGRGFCAGGDMEVLASRRPGSTSASSSTASTFADSSGGDFDGRFTWLLRVRKPVIAAINGPVAGMAIALILCCDIRFMAEDAPLVTAFSQRGLIAEWGVSWLLPRIVGTGNALDLLFSSRRILGREAAEMGLVQRSLPAREVVSHSIKYVQLLAAHSSPTSLSIMKRQVYTQQTAPLGLAEREGRLLMLESFGRPDFQEGILSFQEKRSPKFARLGE